MDHPLACQLGSALCQLFGIPLRHACRPTVWVPSWYTVAARLDVKQQLLVLLHFVIPLPSIHDEMHVEQVQFL